jgi:hypothetical protein
MGLGGATPGSGYDRIESSLSSLPRCCAPLSRERRPVHRPLDDDRARGADGSRSRDAGNAFQTGDSVDIDCRSTRRWQLIGPRDDAATRRQITDRRGCCRLVRIGEEQELVEELTRRAFGAMLLRDGLWGVRRLTLTEVIRGLLGEHLLQPLQDPENRLDFKLSEHLHEALEVDSPKLIECNEPRASMKPASRPPRVRAAASCHGRNDNGPQMPVSSSGDTTTQGRVFLISLPSVGSSRTR